MFLFCCFLATIINAQSWVSGGISANSNQGAVYDIELHNGILFASVNNDGLIKSTDNATTWTKINQTDFETNPNSRHISKIVSTGSELYVVVFYAFTSTSMIYKSTDNGETFTEAIDGFPKAPNDNTRLMNIGNMYFENNQLIAIINGGNYTKDKGATTWQPISDTVKFAEYYDSHNSIMYAFPSYGLYKSTDNGQTWTKPANTNLPQLFLPNNLNVNPTNGRIYVSGKGLVEQIHKLFYSDDEGETWVSANIESDLGTNWIGQPQTIVEIYSYGNLVQLALANDANNSGPEILVSTDSATTFADDKSGIYDAGFGTTEFTRFVKDGNNLFVALNFGQVYKKDVSTLSTSNFYREAFSVSPNPIKMSSTIKVESTLNNATISLFNILGKKIMEKKNISGYSFLLERNDLTKGIYFLKIDDKNQKFSSKKIMIID